MASIIFKGPARYAKHRGRSRKPRRRIGTAYATRDEVLIRMGFGSYAEYLESPFWKAIRDAKLAVDPNCELCDVPATEVHHLSYRRGALSGKKRHALVSICRKCHHRVEIRPGGSKRNFEGVLKMTRKLLRRRGKWEEHTRRGAKV